MKGEGSSCDDHSEREGRTTKSVVEEVPIGFLPGTFFGIQMYYLGD